MKKRAFFGLGNPGDEYAATRHNVGYRVVQALAEHLKAPPFAPARYALMTQVSWRGIQWYFFLPTTYMNLSGDAVAYWREKLDLALEELIVVLDEIQLPMGAIRFGAKGSHGGHNGLAHIIQRLGREDFPRLRIGIGRDFPKGKQVEYVLSPFTSQQEALFQARLSQIVECLIAWAVEGIDKAMNTCNRRFSPSSSVSTAQQSASE
ncbi:MAG: aminoacyl-tRNA hydrolase [Bacteroidia bacterium]|nr:aminoacyl-tRNA hydrolase [Bacteroidia bacterium]MCX7763407.1 aminoacyl-tRNA hydrolase [Bacteroidia bacterium]MDW8057954.1 aminoacyl-tRNA hydrolase [Bacteroidia bacterium]